MLNSISKSIIIYKSFKDDHETEVIFTVILTFICVLCGTSNGMTSARQVDYC